MRDLYRDLIHGARSLARQPAWTLAALFCLALSAVTSTLVYSVVNALLLRPLPFDQPEQLVMVALQERGQAQPHPFSLSEYRQAARRQTMFEALSAWTFLEVSLSGDSPAQVVEAQLVAENYFAALRTAPLAGYVFDEALARQNRNVAVISERLWRSRYGAGSGILGRSVRINGSLFTVTGIVPAAFSGAMGLVASDVWLPASAYPDLARSTSGNGGPFGVFGRLKPRVTAAAAKAELSAIVADASREAGAAEAPSVIVEKASGFGVPAGAVSTITRASAALVALAALLIGVAAANVAALVLARASERRREIAVRLALGASRWRVVRQLLIESLLLALAGGAIGLVLTVWLTAAVTSANRVNDYLSYAVNFRPDVRVALFAFLTSVGTAALFGLAPARLVARTDLIDALGRSSAGRGSGRTLSFSFILAGQIAISTALLVSTGLMIRTYLNAQSVDPGISTSNLIEATIDVNQIGLDESGGRRLFSTLVDRVSHIDGVEGVGMTREAPLASDGTRMRVDADGTSELAGELAASPEYFSVLGIRVVSGQPFAALDSRTPLVAIVNQTMAEKLWPGTSPLGRSFRAGSSDVEVIGVAADVKYRSVVELPRPIFYRPIGQVYSPQITLVVRSRAVPGDTEAALRRAVQDIDPSLAPIGMKTLDEQRESSDAPRRTSARLLALVGGLAVLLAGVGLYGVTAYGARRRVREFGIRLALGATSLDIVALVFRSGAPVVAAGLAAGFLLASMLARVASAMLFGVTPQDPLTMAVVAGIIGLVAGVAMCLPARWSSRVDPALTLRAD